MAVNRKEVEKLKNEWRNDPVFDLLEYAEDPEYIDFKEDLIQFEGRMQDEWLAEAKKAEERLIDEAEGLGLIGLYKILMRHEQLLSRQSRAIEYLAGNESQKAYHALLGKDE